VASAGSVRGEVCVVVVCACVWCGARAGVGPVYVCHPPGGGGVVGVRSQSLHMIGVIVPG